MDHSTAGFPVLHHLLELAQTQVHGVGDAVQPSPPLLFPFSACLQSYLATGPLLMSWLFSSGGRTIGTPAAASVLPMSIQDWFPLGWTGLISLQSKELSRVFSSTTVQNHQFFAWDPPIWGSVFPHQVTLMPAESPSVQLRADAIHVEICQRPGASLRPARFQVPIAGAGLQLCFWPSSCKSEVPILPSLISIDLLEWLTELRKPVCLLECVCALLCLTLCDPMDCSPSGSSVHGIFQARILKQIAISSSRRSSLPRDQTWVSCIGRPILYYCTTWEAPLTILLTYYKRIQFKNSQMEEIHRLRYVKGGVDLLGFLWVTLPAPPCVCQPRNFPNPFLLGFYAGFVM